MRKEIEMDAISFTEEQYINISEMLWQEFVQGTTLKT